MNEWEVFTRRSSPVTSQPIVTLQKRGNLSLNEAAHEMIGRAEHVELLYDRLHSRIGIRPVGDDVPHAYQVRQQKRARSFLISGTAFTKYYQIRTEDSRRFAANMQDDVLVIDLHQALATSSPRGGSLDGATSK